MCNEVSYKHHSLIKNNNEKNPEFLGAKLLVVFFIVTGNSLIIDSLFSYTRSCIYSPILLVPQRPFPTQIDGSSQLSQELTSNILSQQSLTSQKRTKKGECKIKFISETFGDQKHFYSYNLDIGQPATILRFKDDNSRTKLKPDVISLSSEEGPPVKCKKSKPSVPETISESVQEVQQRLSVIMDMNLINVPVLSSAKKVEQWQAQTQNIQKNIETSSASEIMISGVMSLRDPDRVTPSTSSAQLPNLDDDQIFDLPDIRELTHRQIVSDSSSDCEILDEEPPKWVPLRCGEKPYAVIKPFSSPSSRVKLDLKPTSSVLPSSSKVSLGNAENDVKVNTTNLFHKTCILISRYSTEIQAFFISFLNVRINKHNWTCIKCCYDKGRAICTFC